MEYCMSKIISIHSFRGGTGKSNTTANIAVLMAQTGKRVGVIDTDIQSPGIHILFGLDDDQIKFSLNDYLWSRCSVEEAAYDVSASIGLEGNGKIYLIPSSIKTSDITKVLREGYDPSILNEGFTELIKTLNLDVLLIDTHPGLNEETLLSIAISDIMLIIMRPDQQDYQGTGVTVEVANQLDVPKIFLLVNKTPEVYDIEEVKTKVEEAYNTPIAAIIPHSDEMMTLASSGIFVLKHPDHEITTKLKKVASLLLN